MIQNTVFVFARTCVFMWTIFLLGWLFMGSLIGFCFLFLTFFRMKLRIVSTRICFLFVKRAIVVVPKTCFHTIAIIRSWGILSAIVSVNYLVFNLHINNCFVTLLYLLQKITNLTRIGRFHSFPSCNNNICILSDLLLIPNHTAMAVCKSIATLLAIALWRYGGDGLVIVFKLFLDEK